jgi:hypothetical protein
LHCLLGLRLTLDLSINAACGDAAPIKVNNKIFINHNLGMISA